MTRVLLRAHGAILNAPLGSRVALLAGTTALAARVLVPPQYPTFPVYLTMGALWVGGFAWAIVESQRGGRR